MMTSLPVTDEFTFSGIPRLIRMYIFSNLKRIFKAIIGDEWVTSGYRKGDKSKTNRVNPIYLNIYVNDSLRRIQW